MFFGNDLKGRKHSVSSLVSIQLREWTFKPNWFLLLVLLDLFSSWVWPLNIRVSLSYLKEMLLKIFILHIKVHQFLAYPLNCCLVLTSWAEVHLSSVSNAFCTHFPSDTHILAHIHFRNKITSGTSEVINLFRVIWFENITFGFLQ